MAARTRGRWWVNDPWYTDWALWVGAALTVAGDLSLTLSEYGGSAPRPGTIGSFTFAIDIAFGLAAGFVVYVVPLVLLRGLCRAIFRVPSGPLGPRTLRVPFHGVGVRGAVIYTRKRDGTVVARVEGLPPARRAEALAATRERAVSAGFVSGGGAA